MEHWRRVVAIISLSVLAGVLGACRPNRPYMPGSETSNGADGKYQRLNGNLAPMQPKHWLQ